VLRRHALTVLRVLSDVRAAQPDAEAIGYSQGE
jgi:hypothetical protein